VLITTFFEQKFHFLVERVQNQILCTVATRYVTTNMTLQGDKALLILYVVIIVQ